MITTNTTQAPTYYIVAFGPDEADCQTYIDHHDGWFISETAEARATSFFLSLIRDRVRCGFWTNGKLVAGVDTTEDAPLRPAPKTTQRSLADAPEIPGLPRLAKAAFRASERDHSIPGGA
jgi:hypothetical protein